MKKIILILSFFIFQGCAAAKIALEHKDLVTSTRMSESIFLELHDNVEKTIYVDIKNTSDKDIFVVERIKQAIQGRGYQVVDDHKKAFYFLRGNILYVGKTDPSAADSAFLNGFGGGLAGMAIGNEIGGTGGMIGLGLAGAAVEFVANALTKNVTFCILTDLQISEKAEQQIIQSIESKFTQGDTESHQTRTRKELAPYKDRDAFVVGDKEEEFLDKGTIIKQSSTIKTNRRKYRARILSTANQVNLEFSEAQALMETNLAKSIAGIF